MGLNIAKPTFLKRNQSLRSTLNDVPTSTVLISTSPRDNPKARMLRNGLAITSFVYLEDFFKNRVGEVIHDISNSSISFSSFFDKFQEAMTIRALESILNRANMLKRDGDDWLTFIQEESYKVASSKFSKFKLSKFSIGWNKSNIANDDINHAFNVFNIEGGWGTIKKLSEKAGVTLVDPSAIFRNAASRRHAAAHDPKSESLMSELIQFSKDSVVLAMTFDVLLSTSLNEINKPNHDLISGTFKINESNVKFRFIIKVGKYWKEYVDVEKKAIKRSYDLEEAIKQAKKRAVRNSEVILIKDETNLIVDWVKI